MYYSHIMKKKEKKKRHTCHLVTARWLAGATLLLLHVIIA